MKKISIQVSTFLTLFLSFIVSSRYFQKLIFDKELTDYSIFSKLISSEATCKPEDSSIIEFYKNSDKKVLFIILDGFPNELVYKKITNKESKLHNYLSYNSDEYVNTKTVVPYTYLSLPYLLGNINPERNCRFPFIGGNFKPNIIFNTDTTGANNSLCSSDIYTTNFFKSFKRNSNNRFLYIYNKSKVELIQEILKVISRGKISFLSEYGQIVNSKEKCLLTNESINDPITQQISNSIKKQSSNFHVLHEIEYHHMIEDGKHSKKNLEKFDREYFISIKSLILKLKKMKEIDHVLVLSDHGPRLDIQSNNFSDNKINLDNLNVINKNSLEDENIYGIFIYKLNLVEGDLREESLNLKNLLPSLDKRFKIDKFGTAIEMDYKS